LSGITAADTCGALHESADPEIAALEKLKVVDDPGAQMGEGISFDLNMQRDWRSLLAGSLFASHIGMPTDPTAMGLVAGVDS